MYETKATIEYGCRLVRNLEENLENIVNQPELLSRSCDEIIRVFTNVKERISLAHVNLGVGHDEQLQQQLGMASGIQEWLRAQTQFWGSGDTAFGVHGGVLQPEPSSAVRGKMKETDQQEQVGGLVEMGGRDAEEGSMRFRDDVQPMEGFHGSGGSSSPQRKRRRRDEGEKRTVRVPAPLMGNTEIPPEDGYTWRKYGQKDILNSKFPRSYFRCTHQKLYDCPAKKLVQRLDEAPDMFEVTYRGEHTCHLSSTAPSVPPPSLQVRQDIIPPQAAAILHPSPPPLAGGPSNPISLSHWLSIDRPPPPPGEGTSGGTTSGMQMYRDFGLATAAAPSISSGVGPSSAAAPQFGDFQPVADMADVMFNSGSSSNNSMDLIFHSMDDKWDSGEKKH